ncbi:hypothetical protein [Flavobacterium piscis]|uniref:Transposase n=1 Tax=Flavobacterium piscis TaxID=1114874 RepID=A0ABU1YFV1_9FLAO|nr:hypothetical protein [Flavobacterium piscis]MDR7212426.1 hypothetical protein [Flavobacterium piscis]
MSEKYKVIDSKVPSFITIIDWVDLFVRPMSSHIHLIVTAFDGELQNVIRDFKKFTSKKL